METVTIWMKGNKLKLNLDKRVLLAKETTMQILDSQPVLDEVALKEHGCRLVSSLDP